MNRTAFADTLAATILGLPQNTGFAIGLIGPWGSGKTSVLNLMEETLGESGTVEVLHFNPWLYSGTEQLIASFFDEIGSQLKLKGRAASSKEDR